MSQLNSSLLANNPVWDSKTLTLSAVSTGADTIPLSGSYFIVSNVGANNLFITTNPAVPTGILVAPGQSFESACVVGINISIVGTVGQPFSLTQFS
tara:strand:+ start:2173 stop:2460 length:288 start_codon:yes stop_codon:yes gene_type:complete